MGDINLEVDIVAQAGLVKGKWGSHDFCFWRTSFLQGWYFLFERNFVRRWLSQPWLRTSCDEKQIVRSRNAGATVILLLRPCQRLVSRSSMICDLGLKSWLKRIIYQNWKWLIMYWCWDYYGVASNLVTFRTDISWSQIINTFQRTSLFIFLSPAIFRGQDAALLPHILMGFWWNCPYDGWQCGWKRSRSCKLISMLQDVWTVDTRGSGGGCSWSRCWLQWALCSPKAEASSESWTSSRAVAKGVTGQTKIVVSLFHQVLRAGRSD